MGLGYTFYFSVTAAISIGVGVSAVEAQPCKITDLETPQWVAGGSLSDVAILNLQGSFPGTLEVDVVFSKEPTVNGCNFHSPGTGHRWARIALPSCYANDVEISYDLSTLDYWNPELPTQSDVFYLRVSDQPFTGGFGGFSTVTCGQTGHSESGATSTWWWGNDVVICPDQIPCVNSGTIRHQIRAAAPGGFHYVQVGLNTGWRFFSWGDFQITIRPWYVNLAMDANRDGEIDVEPFGPDDEDKDVWEYGAENTGAIIRVNNDNDQGPGIDSDDDIINGPDDVEVVTPMHIRRLGATLPEGWRVLLKVEGGIEAQESVRIFPSRNPDETAVINPSGPHEHEIPAAEVEGDGPPTEYGIEAVRYPGWPEPGFDGLVMLVLELLDDNDDLMYSDSVEVRVAPWMMPSHLDEVLAVYVTTAFDQTRPASHTAGEAPPFPQRLDAALGPTGLASTLLRSEDPWPQDQYEIGFHSAPRGVWRTSLLNSPRFRPSASELGAYALGFLLDSDFGVYGIGETAWLDPALPGWVNTHDSFGNLEVFPQFADWHSGLIYHGHEQGDGESWDPGDWVGWNCVALDFSDCPGIGVDGMKHEVVDFLKHQFSQGPPYPFGTSWLAVAHVDEFISVQATGTNNFRVILASPQIGIDILVQLAHDVFEFEHGQLWTAIANISADDALNNPPPGSPTVTLREFNEGLHIIDGAKGAMRDLGVTDFVEVPAFFISRDWSANGVLSAVGPAQSMLPDMVNMLNVNGELIVPDPNPHPDNIWPVWFGSDPFKQAFESAVGPGTQVRWIDCMEYHYGVGEVHCATNVRREPRAEIQEWWLHDPVQ